MNTQDQPIHATLVADNQRLDFLPAFFGPGSMMVEEFLVYAWMRRLSNCYSGGCWHYYTLSNGGHYMAPEMGGRLTLLVDGNGYEGSMSADAAGIVVCMFVLGQLMHQVNEGAAQDHLVEQYHALREFAVSHPECDAICCAID